jgi:hypothetical protein
MIVKVFLHFYFALTKSKKNLDNALGKLYFLIYKIYQQRRRDKNENVGFYCGVYSIDDILLLCLY